MQNFGLKDFSLDTGFLISYFQSSWALGGWVQYKFHGYVWCSGGDNLLNNFKFHIP